MIYNTITNNTTNNKILPEIIFTPSLIGIGPESDAVVDDVVAFGDAEVVACAVVEVEVVFVFDVVLLADVLPAFVVADVLPAFVVEAAVLADAEVLAAAVVAAVEDVLAVDALEVEAPVVKS